MPAMRVKDDLDEDTGTIQINSLDAVVHLEYTPSTLPPLKDVAATHGGGEWTRFVCISDTHSRTFEIPDGDVLVHSGDLTKIGMGYELKAVMEWICGLPHKIKM